MRSSSKGCLFAREKKSDEHVLLAKEPTFLRVLAVPTALHFFSKFLVSELSEENIEFYHSVNMFVKNCDGLSNELIPSLLDQCSRLVSTYFGNGAARQLNVNDILEKEVRTAFSINEPMKKIMEMRRTFLKAQAEIMRLMGTDAFPRFLKSSFWKDFLSTAQAPNCFCRSRVVHIANGDLYEGQMLNDKIHGHGVYTYHNGDVYVGPFRDGMMHGVGEFVTKATRMRFVGEFVENNKQGKGVMHFPNEDRVEATWKNNQIHGQGTCYDHAGKVYDAFWHAGELQAKVERNAQRLLATYSYADVNGHRVVSRMVFCQSTLSGMSLGWRRDCGGRKTKILPWKFFQQVSIDLKQPQLSLSFKTDEKNKTNIQLIIQPCDPYKVSTQLLLQIQFLETVCHCPYVSMVRSRFLFARIKAGFRHRREKAERLEELELEIKTIANELKRDMDRGLQERKAMLEEEERLILAFALPKWQFEVRVQQLLTDVTQLRQCRDSVFEEKGRPDLNEIQLGNLDIACKEIEDLNDRTSKLLEFEETVCTPESSKISTAYDFFNFRDVACPAPLGTHVVPPSASPPGSPRGSLLVVPRSSAGSFLAFSNLASENSVSRLLSEDDTARSSQADYSVRSQADYSVRGSHNDGDDGSAHADREDMMENEESATPTSPATFYFPQPPFVMVY